MRLAGCRHVAPRRQRCTALICSSPLPACLSACLPTLHPAGPATKVDNGVGPLRIWPGGLCLSRAIGDFDVGDSVIPFPHIKQVGAAWWVLHAGCCMLGAG